MHKLLVIVGPTATGKTKVALELAKKFNGELVSADSRQIYKGMDIGTGKDITSYIVKRDIYQQFKGRKYRVPSYEIEGVPIWLYDIVNPDEEFSVSHFKTVATTVIQLIHARGKLPILVGGTGLYISSILQEMETLEIPRNEDLRNELKAKSLPELQQYLKKKDSKSWDVMNHSDQNNPRRIVRKIEIALATAINEKQNANLQQGIIPMKEKMYTSLSVGLIADKERVEKNIRMRVQERLDQGIIEEIKKLLEKGYSWDLPSMNTFGYKEWKEYMDDSSLGNKQKALEIWIQNEVQYSKKQITWFKKQRGISWFDISEPNLYQKILEKVQVWYTSE